MISGQCCFLFEHGLTINWNNHIHTFFVVCCFSHSVLSDSFATPGTLACQPELFHPWDFPGKKYQSGLPFPSPRDVPSPGIKPAFPALVGRFFTTKPIGKYTCTLELNKYTYGKQREFGFSWLGVGDYI